MNIWVRKQNVVSIPCLEGVCLLLIHSVITKIYSNIVNDLEHPRVVVHELLVSTCPKQVQNEYMGEKTESGAHPVLRRYMPSSDSFRCHHYHLV